MSKSCSIDGCDTPAQCRGWCQKHYTRWKRHGDPEIAAVVHKQQTERLPASTTPVERFWHFVDRREPDGCWPWTGHINDVGYGQMRIDGHLIRVHRFAYERLVGPIPADMVLDHRCHDPETCSGGDACPHRRCCNPSHLLPVSQAENMSAERMSSPERAQTRCKHGHEFTPDNTLVINGSRHCRACAARRIAEFRTRRRSAQ